MDKNIIIESRCALTQDTAEYKKLIEAMRYTAQTVDKLIAGLNRSYWANAI